MNHKIHRGRAFMHCRILSADLLHTSGGMRGGGRIHLLFTFSLLAFLMLGTLFLQLLGRKTH